MNYYVTVSNLSPTEFRPNKKNPIRFVFISLFFIYVFQYNLWRLMGFSSVVENYRLTDLDWIIAYSFVAISTLIFLPALYIGMSGRPIRTDSKTMRIKWKIKRVGLPVVIFTFALFFFWSYLMLQLKIGVTIYIYQAGDGLPFRLGGLLFYGRLFLQPIVLAYIASSYSRSILKYLVCLLLIALGAYVSLTSGSRFLGIMFALPLFLLFNGKFKYMCGGVAILGNILIGVVTRNFYLPFYLGEKYIQIYANKIFQSAVLESVYLSPIVYIVGRVMGIGEVLMTLKFGEITPSLIDSVLVFLSYFLPFVPRGQGVSIKNVYGLSDSDFGEVGLDLFSNYWVHWGGSPQTYALGLVLTGIMLGKVYRLFTIGLWRFGFPDASMLVFVFLFLLVLEGRIFLFPYLFLFGWLISRKTTHRFIYAISKSSFNKRANRPSNIVGKVSI